KPTDEAIAAALKGRRAKVKVVQKPYQGDMQNEIDRFLAPLPLDGAPSGAPAAPAAPAAAAPAGVPAPPMPGAAATPPAPPTPAPATPSPQAGAVPPAPPLG